MITAREINRTEPTLTGRPRSSDKYPLLRLIKGSATIGGPHPTFTDPARVAQGIEQPPPKR